MWLLVGAIVTACGSDSAPGSDANGGSAGSAGSAGSPSTGGAGPGATGGAGGNAGTGGTSAASGSGGVLGSTGGSGGSAGGGGSIAGGGASAGSGGSGGSSEPSPYLPCPKAPAPCVIMPLGDSITWGYNSTTGGGYRLRLLHDIWAGNHDATFVGTGSSGPDKLDGKPFPKSNEGHSGYTIDDAPAVKRSGISPLVPDALAKYSPNVVTLMIGTNDMGTNNDVANAPTRLAHLIDTIIDKSPKALLVIAQITPTGDDKLNGLVQTYNAAIPALVQSRAAAGKHIILVDMYAPFTAHANDLNGLHPNDAGYDLMGDTWYAALAPHL